MVVLYPSNFVMVILAVIQIKMIKNKDGRKSVIPILYRHVGRL